MSDFLGKPVRSREAAITLGLAAIGINLIVFAMLFAGHWRQQAKIDDLTQELRELQYDLDRYDSPAAMISQRVGFETQLKALASRVESIRKFLREVNDVLREQEQRREADRSELPDRITVMGVDYERVDDWKPKTVLPDGD